ncbi:histidine kinase [Aquimarina sp. D1M17]|nr:histidine kinase [Aquimarina acroporae]
MPLVLVFLILNIMLYEYFDIMFHEHKSGFLVHFLTNLLTYISFGVVFYTIYAIKTNYKKQVAFENLLKEKQQAELNALKAQVNPHFLFNTLNTIYANALRKDDNTPELLLKLSDSFRYVLDKSQNDLVAIKDEIQHIRDYIHLQQERLSEKVNVSFSSEIDHEKQEIAPLLLIGFIENAFKYTSILKGTGHNINIDIKLNNNNLYFTCENPYSDSDKTVLGLDETWKKSGVGMKSTQKRLQLLYPETHELIIKQEGQKFIVLLKIEL